MATTVNPIEDKIISLKSTWSSVQISKQIGNGGSGAELPEPGTDGQVLTVVTGEWASADAASASGAEIDDGTVSTSTAWSSSRIEERISEFISDMLPPPSGFVFDTDHFAWNFINTGVVTYELQASYDNGDTWSEIARSDFIPQVGISSERQATAKYTWTPPAGKFRVRSYMGSINGTWSDIITLA